MVKKTDQKDEFNFYRDVLNIQDHDANGEIDWRDAEIEFNELNKIMGKKRVRYSYDEDDFEDEDRLSEDDFEDEDDLNEDNDFNNYELETDDSFDDEELEEADDLNEEDLKDDDSDDDENFDDEEHETTVSEPMITLRVSLNFSGDTQKQDKSIDDVKKYKSGSWWEYKRALIDNFPELAEDYEGTSCELSIVIRETWKLDQQRAVKYLKWIWKTFTPDLFVDEDKSSSKTQSYMGRGQLIYVLIDLDGESKDIYDLLKNDEDFLYAAFRDCVHSRHDINLLKDYMSLMLKHNDVDMAKVVYNCYLKWQTGRYSNRDLGVLWDGIIFYMMYEVDMDEKEKIAVTEDFRPLIEEIGMWKKQALSCIESCQKEWWEEIENKLEEEFEDDEEDEEDDDEEDEYAYDEEDDEEDCEEDDKYAWRNNIAPSKLRFANPNEYETLEEYEKAVNIEYAKHQKEQLKIRLEGYSENNICNFCKVDIKEPYKSLFYYSVGNLDLKIGDEVVVPFGYENRERDAIVVSLGQCYASTFAFDISKLKTVIRKK